MKTLLQLFGRLDWIRFGVRNRVIYFFNHPDRARSRPFECDFFGARYQGDLNNFIDWHVFHYGAYCPEELACMGDFLATADRPVVVDVGANIGHHTLFASTRAAKVHAFEPYRPVLEKLERKLRLNRIEHVVVHPVGLADLNDSLPYAPPSTTNTGTGTFVGADDAEGRPRLELRRADDYFPAAGIDRIDFLKMDVEGFEVSALRGMTATLAERRPVCFLEWTRSARRDGPANGVGLFPARYTFHRFVTSAPLLGVFKRHGYRLHPLGEDWPDCELVAVPEEYWTAARARRPAPAILSRLAPAA